MKSLNFLRTTDAVTIADEVFTLALPPPSFGLVDDFNARARARGVVPEIRLEIWANAAVNLTSAELFGAAPHAVVLADDAVEAVDTGLDQLTLTGHAYLTGDGPIRIASSGTMIGGLAAGTDYWVISVDANTIQLATSRTNAMLGIAIDLTSAGTGTRTLRDTADTERVHWHSEGLLGPAEDGAITLTAQRAYATRRPHDPRTFAYALSATLSTSDPEWVSAAVYPIEDRG